MTQPPLFPVAPKLRPRQARILQLVDHDGIAALDAGTILHQDNGCRYCRQQPCQYAEQAGRQVLEALRKKGLIRRDRHHRYFPVGGKPTSQTDTFPPGF